jgi:hypothetical protein
MKKSENVKNFKGFKVKFINFMNNKLEYWNFSKKRYIKELSSYMVVGV